MAPGNLETGRWMVIILVLASLAITIGFAFGIYAGTVAFFLAADLDEIAAVVQP